VPSFTYHDRLISWRRNLRKLLNKITNWLQSWVDKNNDEIEALDELGEAVQQGYKDFLRKTCQDMTEEGLSREQIERAMEKMQVKLNSTVDDDGHLNIEFSWKDA